MLKFSLGAFKGPKMTVLIYRHGGCKLKNYPDTRFCYFRMTCESVLKDLEILQIISELPGVDVSDEVKEIIYGDDFERNLRNNIRLLTPICTLINHCQDPKVNLADGTEQWLSMSTKLPHEYQEMLQDRIFAGVFDVGYAANLLHPVYRGVNLDEDQNAAANNFLIAHLNDVGRQEKTTFLTSREASTDMLDDCNDPITYWTLLSDALPNLGKLALKLMIIPASTALIEGFFSQWTYVHNQYRNRLSNETSGVLIDLYHLSKHLDGEVWTNTVSKRKRQYIDVDDDM